MSQVQTPIPSQNESHEDYIVRAHRELMPLVRDPDQRNTMVWSAWQHYRGTTPAEQRAREEFGDESRFIPKRNVCYFVEHETIDSQGNPIQFALGDLVEITRTCNKRVSDRKAFSAISDNHTSPTDQSHEGDPPVLGAVGNYKLGMIGHEIPKFGIFADEYHRADKAGILKNKPRRSIELVTFHNTGERFIDPVAALGGRAPRLPMPSQYSVMSYSADGQSRAITRYQMAGPEMVAGPSNTHVKSTDYFSDHEPHEPNEDSMIADEDISKIINAIGNMPEFAWVRQQMDAENGGAVSPDAPGGLDDVGGGEGGFDDLDSFGGPDTDDKQVDRNAAFQPGGASGSAVVTPPNEDAMYEEQQRYSAAYYHSGGAMQQNVTVDQFQAMQSHYKRTIGDMGQRMQRLEQENLESNRQRIDADRRSEINRVCYDIPGVYDPEEEFSRLLYSAGANVSDEAFKAEIARMETLGNRLSIQQNTIPRGEIYRSNQGATIDRNSAWYAKSLEIQEVAANKGETYDWNELQRLTDESMAKK